MEYLDEEDFVESDEDIEDIQFSREPSESEGSGSDASESGTMSYISFSYDLLHLLFRAQAVCRKTSNKEWFKVRLFCH